MRTQGPREASGFTKFRLLMWKNFLQQWRHRGQTAVELLLPVVTMALVLILRWQIEPSVMETRTYPVLPAGSLNHSMLVFGGMNFPNVSIAYSPANPELQDIVQTAVSNLLVDNAVIIYCFIRNGLGNFFPDLTEIEFLPTCEDVSAIENFPINDTFIIQIVKNLIRVNPYENSDALKSIYVTESDTRKVLAAVEFDDALRDITSLPKNISYSLRFPERPRLSSLYSMGGMTWRTELLFPVYEIPGPRFPYSLEGGNDPGYVNELFIPLQHVISTEIISRITKVDIRRKLNVNIRRYPHPEYVEDMAVTSLQLLFSSFIMLSFSYTAINIVRAITIEKELQLKESMKIMGLPTWLHWTAWFFKQFLYLLISVILIVILLKVNWFTNEHGFSEYAVFTNTPWSVLAFFLLLYLSCAILFCFMISGFYSKASTAALCTAVFWFLSNLPAVIMMLDVEFSTTTQALTCLCINSAMSYGFNILIAKESTGGMQWGSFMDSSSTESSRFTFGHVIIMLVVDCVIYLLITLYLEQVLPGPFGTPKPWYFIVQKEFWLPSKKYFNDDVISTNADNLNNPMEKDPNLPIGVQITNLTKIYGSNTAVDNLSLNIFDNQITVLLGHNGAGKSTTISMLTGNVEITHGTVNLAGYNIKQYPSAARAHLGLCPQHNVIFNALTVREHLEFFASLKGFTGKELKEEIDMLIDKLELQDKRDYQAQGLSGGQKRRLCVGIALSGAAKVVLLDEPTSGMDPASRRALWDLLQKEKKGRSMILTTHFMDEADILGDRVAIMASGRLQCVGSPFFLKRHYGVGYTLVLVKDEDFNYQACTEIITKFIPGNITKEDRGSEVTYNLLNEYSHLFEKLLKDLEDNKDVIHFKNYGLTATTLEDVFMSVGSDTPAQADVDDNTIYTESSEDLNKYEFESAFEHLDQSQEDLTWYIKTWRHIRATWLKLWLVWTRSWGIALVQILAPCLIMIMSLFILEFIMSFVENVTKRHLSLTEGYLSTETFLNYIGFSTSSLGYGAKQAYVNMFDNVPDSMKLTDVDEDLQTYYLNRTSDPAILGKLRNQLLTGASFTDDSATAWFSNFAYHELPTSLAAVHNAVLKSLTPDADLQVYNHPLQASYNNQGNMELTMTLLSMQVTSGISYSMAIVSSFFVMFYIRERVSRAKLLQKAAGIQPVVLWGTATIFDWTWLMIISLSVPIINVIFQVTGLSSFSELGRLYFCIMIFGLSVLPLNYLLSLVFNSPALGFVVVFFGNILLGIIAAQIVEALQAPMLDTKHVADGMDYVFQFSPLYALVTCISRLHSNSLKIEACVQSCNNVITVLPNVTECDIQVMCDLFPNSCCLKQDSYWDWEKPGITRYLTTMITSGLVLYAILLILEYRVLNKLFTFERQPPPLDPSELDEDVAAETKHVQMMDIISIKQNNLSLLVKDISKYYGKNLAVDQLSFTVSPGEIFGLLGVNGAGKTTTFKMLMGDESVSSGDAYVASHSVKTDLNNVHKNIGYCPQFDAVFGELTGRETLRMFAMLRGLHASAALPVAVFLAQALGFTKHMDKRVDQYSGGNKRKLSTAIALLGRTRLVSVDEPTTGVDPAAKRQVWRALRGARAANRGILLTSHSMEECEALCSRLAIMVNGRFQCLGTPQHLKNKFSEGFTLTVKIKVDENSRDSNLERRTRALKSYIDNHFTTAKILEEYQGLITYYLADSSVPWSQMFAIMERSKQELNVEDYSISQTTLEQIFLQFTKYQKL